MPGPIAHLFIRLQNFPNSCPIILNNNHKNNKSPVLNRLYKHIKLTTVCRLRFMIALIPSSFCCPCECHSYQSSRNWRRIPLSRRSPITKTLPPPRSWSPNTDCLAKGSNQFVPLFSAWPLPDDMMNAVKFRLFRNVPLLLSLLSLLLLVGSSVGHEDTLLDEMTPVKEEDAGDYLMQFGYTTPSQLNAKTEGMAGDLSNVFETAVKAFQEFAHLPATGLLDIKTRKKMAEPRCGMQDSVEMMTDGKAPAFKWKKNDLTYTFHSFTPDLPEKTVKEAIKTAFGIWGAVTPLKFKEVPSSEKADINIKFATGMHDDPWPFDKKGGVLAHATMPPSGMLHFDEAENWVYMDAAKIKTHKYTDLLPVAIHEGGHALGLSHSKADDAIMAPFYQEQIDKDGRYIYPELQQDDIHAIQAIYGPKKGGSGSETVDRKTVQSQGTARGGGGRGHDHEEEEEEEERPRTTTPRSRTGGGGRGEEDNTGSGGGGGQQQTVGQVLWNKGKVALKQMFMNWLHNRRR